MEKGQELSVLIYIIYTVLVHDIQRGDVRWVVEF